jgi:nitroreductase
MTQIARLELGLPGPDGARAYTVVDSDGHRQQGVFHDAGVVDDYLDYLDSLGSRGLVVTETGPPGEPQREPREPAQPRPPAVSRVPIRPDQAGYLIATAGRAPSVHNTQPWRFLTDGSALELYADRSRILHHVDPSGREMLISCGAALFGLRLGVRRLGYLPVVDIFPSAAARDLLARVRLGAQVPPSRRERALVIALAHRHTHRGPFTADPVPPSLLPALQHDAMSEGATLVLLGRLGYEKIADVVAAADRLQRAHPVLRAELRRWTRAAGSKARDGVPVAAFAASPERPHGALAMRDFDLGRGWGELEAGGAAPDVTALLITPGDDQVDWLRAGQALNRVLVHAASKCVFASLHTQPLESAPLRAEIRARLGLPGAPQMLLQLGRADVTKATARRPVGDPLVPP